MKKLIKRITCVVLVAALVASLAGCAKLNYVTNGTIQAIQEVKSGEWKNAGKDSADNAAAEEDASVLDKSFEAGTYGGVEFKSLEDVANYYVEAYNYTKTLTAQYKDADGKTQTFYKMLGSEKLEVGSVMIDGKENSTINSLVPSIVGPMFDANIYGLVPSGNRNPELDNNLDDPTRKNDHDYRTSTFTGDDILDANIVDNGDGTITMTIQPKQEELAFRGEGTQGSFFEVLGDITAAVKSISVLSFTEGDASDNVKVMYKGGTGVITIDTKTKEITAAKYVMIANVDVTHASIAIIKDKSASVKITYTNEYPASDDYLKERRGVVRL